MSTIYFYPHSPEKYTNKKRRSVFSQWHRDKYISIVGRIDNNIYNLSFVNKFKKYINNIEFNCREHNIKILLSTNNSELVEASSYDRIWG